ncbi:hypothetical protein H5P28_00340 [Ruficoccus amylovorans]|uniref:Uncharacterized protein n=1 Tax=Ruficoccus amylovorans TaxID=1804625 RepID=A0A842H8M9_9BACT|nr:hypothetical protein [Ruficoccus amylovorans]MBC2592700.1 hypothetical protein [Ruficoccus amylovorans]
MFAGLLMLPLIVPLLVLAVALILSLPSSLLWLAGSGLALVAFGVLCDVVRALWRAAQGRHA